MLRHHLPFRDDGLAKLPGLLGAGDLVDLHRDLLAAVFLQLRRLRIVDGDDLKRLRSGYRRGWLVFSQLLLIAAILLLALTDPGRSPLFVALGALLVAAMSSTQDIVVDAFRVESLPESEQAAGMASYVAAYRIGMLVSTAGALFLVSGFEATGVTRTSAWMWGYMTMAALVLIGTATALAATEPEQSARAEAATRMETAFVRVVHAAAGAFSEFLVRKDAGAALAFVVLFKFTDAFSGTMTAPFVIDLGFTRNDYAAIVKGVGLAATLIGGFAGGFVARRYSLAASLWIGGVLQAVANLSFTWLALSGVNEWALAFAISMENFTSAIGTVIFVAYLSALCRNPLHTATQYALLTALAAVGRTYLSSGAGYVAKATGWPLFFAICVVVAVPSLVLLVWLQRRGHFEGLETEKV
jgi:MFS transporter, PAT family, beta-lactamase induction signal transducer AmpG